MGNFVLSGHRRLQAAVQLGLQEVPVREQLISDEDPLATLIAESQIIETNRQRVKTESQKDAEAVALLRIETQLAAARKTAGVAVDPSEAGKAVNKVAKKMGESPSKILERVDIANAKIPPAERNGKKTHVVHENLPNKTNCIVCQLECDSKAAMKKHFKEAHQGRLSEKESSAVALAVAQEYFSEVTNMNELTTEQKAIILSKIETRVKTIEDEITAAEKRAKIIDAQLVDSTSTSPETLADTFYVVRNAEGYLMSDETSFSQDITEAAYFNKPEGTQYLGIFEWVKVEATYRLTPIAI